MAAKKKGKAKKKPAHAAAKTKKPAPKKAAPKPKARPAAKAAPAHNPWPAYANALEREAATTVRLMQEFPADKAEFQPHPRSSSAMRLFWTFAVEQGMAIDAIKGTLKMPPHFPPPPATLSECIGTFKMNVARVVQAARAAKAADYHRPVQFFGGPGKLVHVPAGMVADMMLADQIHHRGQLSVYTRMAGGKVPSIYGPSADEPW